MKQNPKGQRILNLVIFSLVIVGAIWTYRYTKRKDAAIQHHGRYTVGTVTGFGKGHRSAEYSIDYKYNVYGWKFEASMSVPSLKGINIKGGKYIVRFLPENPKQSKVLLDSPVVWHSILPDSGWTVVPDYIFTTIKKESSNLP